MRLIDADELNIYDISPAFGFSVMGVTQEDIDDAPTVDAEPVRHGKWIIRNGGYYEKVIDCSVCERCKWSAEPYENLVRGFKYCHSCGAKMDEVEE